MIIHYNQVYQQIFYNNKPTICKNSGFSTYLVNEFITSKLCNCCHKEIEPFMIRKSHKPKDIIVNKKITVNGLLSHQEDKQKCEIIITDIKTPFKIC